MHFLSAARVRLHYRVAKMWLRLGRHEAAASAYERVLGALPGDPQAQFQRAWSLLNVESRRNEGIEAFRNLLQTSPSSEGYFLLGCGLQEECRHSEAVEAFEEAARLGSPGTSDLHYNSGVALTALLRWDEARDAFQRAVDLSPSEAGAWDGLGTALAHIGQLRDAAPCHRRAMRLEPCAAHGLNLSRTLYELNQLEEAHAVLRQVLSIEPASVPAKESLVVVLTGQDRYDEAIGLGRELCARDPEALTARLVLAGALSEAGHTVEALTEARVAVNLQPDDAQTYAALGAIYLKTNDGAGALAAFERALQCPGVEDDRLPSGGWIVCIVGRGAALAQLNRHAEALTDFEDVLRIDATFFERWPEMASYYQKALGGIGRGSEARAPIAEK